MRRRIADDGGPESGKIGPDLAKNAPIRAKNPVETGLKAGVH
jgi:hypothetical protein